MISHLLIYCGEVELTGENERLNVIVLAQLPDEELRKVSRVDELTQWLSRSANDEGSAVL